MKMWIFALCAKVKNFFSCQKIFGSNFGKLWGSEKNGLLKLVLHALILQTIIASNSAVMCPIACFQRLSKRLDSLAF